jgi:hypothetical protein
MRLIVAILGALLVAGCAAPTVSAPTPPAVPDAPLLASEGGILRPIDNGGRIAMHGGYAMVRLSPSPQSMDPLLQVSLFDTADQPMTADVSVDYESLDMDHGISSTTGMFHDGCYRMGLSFGMAGSWRVIIHVARAGNEERLTLVLPWVGL